MVAAPSEIWAVADDYRYLEAASLPALAWEWLRRDPDYRRLALGCAPAAPGAVSICQSASDNVTARWGCLNMPDADRTCADAPVLWCASIDPSVLSVVAFPVLQDKRLGFDISSCGSSVTIVSGKDCEHVLLRRRGVSMRLDVISGSLLDGPVRILFDLADVADIENTAAKLRRFMLFRLAGNSPTTCVPPGQALRRQILALRVHDALAGGASIRDVGIILFGAARVRDEWSGEALKSQCRRLIALAKSMAGGGYRRLL